MKILFLHTYYLQKGGEDAVFEQDYKLLQQSEQVTQLSFRNRSGWRGALQFLLSPWNIFAARKLKNEIKRQKPDIIHLHNLHFAIGPIALHVARKAGIPVVVTLHNYRLLCPSGIYTSTGDAAIDRYGESFPWRSVREKVYRNSYLQTFWLAFIVWIHKQAGTWQLPDKYIVQTEHSREIFINSSIRIPGSKFIVNPNFVHAPLGESLPKKDHFLFVGRLSHEKGISVLLDSFAESHQQLFIAGDGPLKGIVQEAAQQHNYITYLGRLDKEGVRRAMEQCTALIFPSVWSEGMPMTILEAFSLGVPVIASNYGAMAVLIRDGYNGLSFEMGNAAALTRQVQYWKSLTPLQRNLFSQNAKQDFEDKYNPGQYKKQMTNIYQNVLADID